MCRTENLGRQFAQPTILQKPPQTRGTNSNRAVYSCLGNYLGPELINRKAEKMFPSNLSANDLGVLAVVMLFGLIVVLLSTFDWVSTVETAEAFLLNNEQ